ncbi:heavy metal-associated isoprenylated plant protein 35-like [Phragmites australis]|uniref:heavy metal-associated isoprenylated plant protein 35-like n=1 Tax=Phragmites australis TaxID=29695 RepID=UPI002D77C2E9|nr:heavy metal-associated isoprenylated plant protein 35-like [Phragmites australis]
MLFSRPAPPQDQTLPLSSAPSWCSALPLPSLPLLLPPASSHLLPSPSSFPSLCSAMAAAEEGPEPLRYQTLALKVSIHCEGCKKKVKKVLHSIEGVYKTDIDMQHQKVVVIGNVSTDALVKKLLKTGKHAEPWPEPAPPVAANPPGGGPGSGGKKKKKKKSKSKNLANNKPAGPAPAPAEGGSGPCPPEKQDHDGSCDEASDGEHDKPEGGGGNGSPGAGDAHEGGAGKVAPFAMTPHGMQPVAPAGNGSGGGFGGGKKKGKKGGNDNANGDGAGAIVEVHPPDAPTKPVAGNAGPLVVVDNGPYPPPPATSYPGYYSPGGHSPAYVVSYSTAHPSSALRSSAYYHPMVGAAYTEGGGNGGYFYSTAPVSAPPGSYYMFSEENANACSVM